MRRQGIRITLSFIATLMLTLGFGVGCETGDVMEDDEAIGGGPIEGDYGVWDEDDDGILSEDEFSAGVEDEGIFDNWDENNDDQIDQEEFQTSTQQTGLIDADFDVFDADEDGLIENDEFNQGLFETYDEDDSGFIENDEWGQYEPGLV